MILITYSIIFQIESNLLRQEIDRLLNKNIKLLELDFKEKNQKKINLLTSIENIIKKE